ncbi:MAG: hypothetical protein CO002_02470 [Candidatus Portnoybacteria bacterium CG_4_8_14_3_um_filter_44_10]|uniref:Caspase family p20 domain-containing protein n=1 Tax=Candidatus Portnoybacteria bacterium CG_4_8_14_3_um_filter_44_10 TaxID=1974802 RepID=A0A2M7IFQ6_9BACT|nr:MAG: hypothetical protein CO002_02470 [Candidatus Portnoybacteria bacterium CG_4_8_14_3_um_filter_44_10]
MKRLTILMALAVFLMGCATACPIPNQYFAEAPETAGQKYAILISGQIEGKHIKNIEAAFGVLLKSGFLRKNIIIFDATGNQNRPYPVNAPADAKSIRLCLRYLANQIGPNDLLFIYVTDHGRLDERLLIPDTRGTILSQHQKKQKIAEIGLFGRFLDEIDFAACVDKIKPGIGVFIFTQCYGGSFAERLAGKNRITISANEKYATCDSRAFSKLFFSAFYRKTADNVSVREAFEYVIENNNSFQEPQMFYGVKRDIYLNQ